MRAEPCCGRWSAAPSPHPGALPSPRPISVLSAATCWSAISLAGFGFGPPTEATSLLSYRAFDFCAAALTDVNHLNQAIGELDRLACFRFHRIVFFCRHPAPTARTDHNWLSWARPHA